MQIFSVSQFIEFLNAALASAVFPEGVAIEGEVAEYRVSQEKWIWFKLKDEQSIVDCFATVWQLRAPLEDGMKVRAFGLPKIHAKSGRFSMNVERVEFIGEGALRRAFELLKKKLDAEGLFAPARKRLIPQFPSRIGLIASRESAAYTDFLRILKNRWGGVTVSSAHVQVQGRDAIRDIVGAFRYFNAHTELAEVVVLTRGGGSLEDLQAFNSEEVARAVFGSKIPVVVGVGHERDESLADYVADIRASTPSNAAELVAPDRREIASMIDGGVRRMDAGMRSALAAKAAAVRSVAARIDAHARRGLAAAGHRIRDVYRRLDLFVIDLKTRLERLDAAVRLLATLDPRRPLRQGYAFVRSAGKIVRDASQVDIGARVDIQLYKGGLVTEVKERI